MQVFQPGGVGTAEPQQVLTQEVLICTHHHKELVIGGIELAQLRQIELFGIRGLIQQCLAMFHQSAESVTQLRHCISRELRLEIRHGLVQITDAPRLLPVVQPPHNGRSNLLRTGVLPADIRPDVGQGLALCNQKPAKSPGQPAGLQGFPGIPVICLDLPGEYPVLLSLQVQRAQPAGHCVQVVGKLGVLLRKADQQRVHACQFVPRLLCFVLRLFSLELALAVDEFAQ